jgi:hypothetical protein
MKRWAIITVLLYGTILLVLAIPGLALLSLEYSKTQKAWSSSATIPEILELLKHWGFWLWLAIMIAAQSLLLLVPVDLARQRLPARRKLFWPVVTASLLLGNLAFTGFFCVLAIFVGDNATIVVEAPTEFVLQVLEGIPGVSRTALGMSPGSDLPTLFAALGMMLLFWLSWALIFFHYAQSDQPDSLVRRATKWLLRASILELLVAVPSHIVVRQRGDCCAPFATFWGIVSGISIMLLSFGPGVFFLFAKRMRRLQPNSPSTSTPQVPAPPSR